MTITEQGDTAPSAEPGEQRPRDRADENILPFAPRPAPSFSPARRRPPEPPSAA